jgi:hypothetical protein
MNRLERFIKEGGYSYQVEMLAPTGKTPRYLLTIRDKEFVIFGKEVMEYTSKKIEKIILRNERNKKLIELGL